jgi:hypothetical protein
MKIHLCIVITFFQLAASLRQDDRSLRGFTDVDTKNKDGERGYVVPTSAVTVVEPKQACADGVTATDSAGKCCGIGEMTVNGVCCPAGVTAVASISGQCCAPGQIAAPNLFGFTFCCPPDSKVASSSGTCCNASIKVAKLLCELW